MVSLFRPDHGDRIYPDFLAVKGDDSESASHFMDGFFALDWRGSPGTFAGTRDACFAERFC